MPLGANRYYSDPTIGRIGSNLATAIYGDPEARLKRGLYDAQAENYGAETERNRAEAGKYGAETDKLREEARGQKGLNDAQDNLGNAISMFSAPIPGESPQDTMTRNAPAVAAFMKAHRGNTQEASTALGNIWAQIMGQGDPDQVRRGLTLQGKMPDQNFSPTGAIADQNAGRNSDLITGQELAKQNLANRGSMGTTIYTQGQENKRNDINEAGRNSRFYNAPITAPANSTVFLPKPNPNFAQFGDRVYGRTDTTGRLPSEISLKDVEDAVFAGARQIPGATMPDPTKPGDTIINPDFEKQFPPAKVVAARSAAAQVFQQTRDVTKAANAYTQTLGVQAGSSYTPPQPAGISSLWMGKGTPGAIVPPVGAAPQAGPVTPAAPMGAQTQPAPPPEQRRAGQVYQTPKGPLTWTGTGWR